MHPFACKLWKCGGSNPGPNACKACALPLRHIPFSRFFGKKHCDYPNFDRLKKQQLHIRVILGFGRRHSTTLRPFHAESAAIEQLRTFWFFPPPTASVKLVEQYKIAQEVWHNPQSVRHADATALRAV
jgi:hypothetical protein